MNSRNPVVALGLEESSFHPGRHMHRPGKRARWYFVIPVLSLGLLSAIPFFRPWVKSRERRIALLTVLYSAAGVVAFTISTLTQSRESQSWQRLETFGYAVGWMMSETTAADRPPEPTSSSPRPPIHTTERHNRHQLWSARTTCGCTGHQSSKNSICPQ